ncbi:VOC family protein [Kribbella qitaiheensis]|uniref:VOC family protein n=1 Tax=Kribbella qitaiheensis TaxID=1544730 RepID=UPI0016258783|nr:VOC family protein [Kribbella qitaiheensis]
MSHTQSIGERGEPTAALSMLNIDSADPARLARFYAAALGWKVTYSDDSYGMVEGCPPFPCASAGKRIPAGPS